MFSIEATPGVSIVIRSKDPNFCPSNMVFVTEYSGAGGAQPSSPFQLSVLKEEDQSGQLIRISVMHAANAPACPTKGPSPLSLSPASSHDDTTRNSSPNCSYYSNSNTGYPSPSPSLGSGSSMSFPLSDAGSSHTSSSSGHCDPLDFNDYAFGEALHNFHDSFGSPYGDMQVLTNHDMNASDQMRPSHQYYTSDAFMNSSSYSIPSTPYLSSSSMTHDSPSSFPHTRSNSLMSLTDSVFHGGDEEVKPKIPGLAYSNPRVSTSSKPQPDQNDPKRIYMCRHEGCEKRFARKYHRQVHENSHKPKVRLLLLCREEGCSAKFGRPHDRMRHEVAKHGLRPNFVCKECGKFFGTQSKLRGHKCDLMPSQRHRWTEPAIEA